MLLCYYLKEMKLCALFSLLFVASLSQAQQNKNSIHGAINMPLSFTDAPIGVGYGLSFGWSYLTKSRLGFGAELNVNRVRGGNESLNDNKRYFFGSTVATLAPYVDYTFELFSKKKLEVIPGIGGGLIGFITKGGFYDVNNALNLYQEWGEPHFIPEFNKQGVVIDATSKKIDLAFAVIPTLTIAYKLKYNLRVYMKTGYQFTTTDDLDAFNLPTAGNQGKDIIQTNYIGVSYLLYKRRIK
jgi:hypothetical protein